MARWDTNAIILHGWICNKRSSTTTGASSERPGWEIALALIYKPLHQGLLQFSSARSLERLMISSHCCPVGLHGYDLGRSHSSLAVFSINGRGACQLYGEIWSLKTSCWILGQGDMKLALQHGEVE
ncbi:uncharacterized protein SEPMUDRAFT_127266 [Sphaerulina musiva SO2202]|uniref:Uncharacterized protein n=1 Tax=Sphaerulina musiva (strain SO2202) TaxID=692275 RepID=N1QE50_SPHMS|nr:uncharacterized protein SEPMUDRAFT_127266 [Sphaerulina musiva SO2202]EMF10585.1 hypothetical protein SEPMUDRAFT_127266 [Sphaerulina musiva SO2202]